MQGEESKMHASTEPGLNKQISLRLLASITFILSLTSRDKAASAIARAPGRQNERNQKVLQALQHIS